jgi:polyisoprenoid-binding protein YceI
MKKILAFTMSFLMSLAVLSQTTWNLDKSHTSIKFSVVHMMISDVEGKFDEFDGTVTSSSDDFDGAEVNFSAKTASVNTDNERRDGHLQSDDFFNSEEYPEISFNGKIEKEGSDYFLVGDFTMRDVTKPVKFDVKYNGTIPGRRGKKAGFKVTGTISRFDYGLKWDSTMDSGSLVVSEDVEITCNIELNEEVSN